MKDKQGVVRGKCTTPGCECSEYMAPQDLNSARCDYCDHVPVKHLKMIKLGACSCGQCNSYESEDPASYPSCSYCDCPAQRHKGAEQLITPGPRPVPAQPSQFPGTGPPTGSFPTSMRPSGAMPPSGAMTPGVVPTCKLPGCTKLCYVEKGGRVHDFCGKSHAAHYKKTQPQQPPMQAPQPMMYKQPATTTTAVLYKPAASSSTMMIVSKPQQPPRPPGPTPAQLPMAPPPKVCEKCGMNPANPNHKWCQGCYQSS